MRYSASEKIEIIHTVEASHLPVKQTLSMIGVPSSTYYDWYARWVEGGLNALVDRSPRPQYCPTSFAIRSAGAFPIQSTKPLYPRSSS
ncbi:helix-turn-helix domain-containing protein [Rhodobacteraceae bacterium Araon29]